MSEETLFAPPVETTPVDANAQTQPPTLPEEVMALVGTGKKYATVDDALKSVPHAQQHIARLELEMQELRDKASQAKAIDEVYEALMSRQATEGDATATPAVFDEKVLDTMLERKLTEQKQVEARKQNAQSVRDSLTNKFGDKASEVFRKKAEELGLNEKFLTDLASTSPKAALELFGANLKEKPSTSAPSGTINLQALNLQQQPVTQKPVMGGASNSDIVSAWRAARPQTT